MKPIQQLINEGLVRGEHKRSGKWSPSSFGRCYRNQYWNRLDKPQSNPLDARTLRVFKAGGLFHDFVQRLLIEKNKYEVEVLVESADVKGFADMVSENEVVDIKSQHSKAFWYMAKIKTDEQVKKDKYPNWLQVLYYTRELHKEFGRLVFISKDDLCIKEYVQPLDDFWLNQLEEELSVLRAIWVAQNLPPASPRCFIGKDGKSRECNYCNYRDLCKQTEKKNENV